MQDREKVAIVALGSNLGNRAFYLEEAVKAINKEIGEVYKVSSTYETKPWVGDLSVSGFNPQYSFYLNSVLIVKTKLDSLKILSSLLRIENRFGRNRPWRIKGNVYFSRTLDLDLIAVDSQIIDSKNLTLPHKYMHLRDFVLVPLEEIFPTWVHPKEDKGIKTLINTLKSSPTYEKTIK